VFAPVRFLASIRPEASAGVLGGAGVVTAVFAATPFLIPEIATGFGIAVGTAGLVSTAQVGGFALASFLAGRLGRPSAVVLRAAIAVLVVTAAASAYAPSIPVLFGLRAVAGAGMGVITWVAWADATRFRKGVGDVAATGPIAATIVSPVLGWLAGIGSYRAVYLALAVISAAALAMPIEVEARPRVGGLVSPSRSNRVLLLALALLTCFGSSVFVFGAAAGAQIAGLGPVAVSLGFSFNALAGVAATRRNARPGSGGWWMIGTAVSALAVSIVPNGVVFILAMGLWGYSFWMGLPEILRLIAARSLRPDERVGDAHSLMAVGRVAGPAVGGIALGDGRFALLGIVGGSGLLAASLLVAVVERYRLLATPAVGAE
jgi:predicted MFS family arabinose efflux permease